MAFKQLWEWLLGKKEFSPQEQRLIDTVAEVTGKTDRQGIPLYLWGDIEEALRRFREEELDEPQAEALLKGAHFFARRWADPCWLLQSIVGEIQATRRDTPFAEYTEIIHEMVVHLADLAVRHDRYRREIIFGQPRIHWWFEPTEEDERHGYVMPQQLIWHLLLPVSRRLATAKEGLSPERLAHAWSVTRATAKIVDTGCSEINYLIHNCLHNIIDNIPNYRMASSETLFRFAKSMRETYDLLYRFQPDRLLLAQVWTPLTQLFNKRNRNIGLAQICDVELDKPGEAASLVLAELIFLLLRHFPEESDLPQFTAALADLLDGKEDTEQRRILFFLQQAMHDPQARLAARNNIYSILAFFEDEVPQMSELRRLLRTLGRVRHPARDLLKQVAALPANEGLALSEGVAAWEEHLVGTAEPPGSEGALCYLALQGLAESRNHAVSSTTLDEEKNSSLTALVQRTLDKPHASSCTFTAFSVPLRFPVRGGHRVRPDSKQTRKRYEMLLSRFFQIKMLVERSVPEPLWESRPHGLRDYPEGFALPAEMRPYHRTLVRRLTGKMKSLQKDCNESGNQAMGQVLASGITEMKVFLEHEKLRLAHWGSHLAALLALVERYREPLEDLLPVLAQALLEMAVFLDPACARIIARFESVEEMNTTALTDCRFLARRSAELVTELAAFPGPDQHLAELSNQSIEYLEEGVERALGEAFYSSEISKLNNRRVELTEEVDELHVTPAPPSLISLTGFLGLQPLIEGKDESGVWFVLTRATDSAFVGVGCRGREGSLTVLELKRFCHEAIFPFVSRGIRKELETWARTDFFKDASVKI